MIERERKKERMRNSELSLFHYFSFNREIERERESRNELFKNYNSFSVQDQSKYVKKIPFPQDLLKYKTYVRISLNFLNKYFSLEGGYAK